MSLGFSREESHSREWVAVPFSRDLPDPGIEPRFPALQADSLLSEPPGKPFKNIRFKFAVFDPFHMYMIIGKTKLR